MRKWGRRGAALAAAVTLAAGAAAGCGKKENAGEKEIVIRLSSWGDVKENAILSDLIGEFQRANPGVRVELQRVPWGEYVTKLLTQYAGGVAPDVIFVSTDDLANFHPRGLLEPLNAYFESDPDFRTSDYDEGLIDRYTIDGKLYAVPRDVAPVCVVYYNRNAFEQAGVAYPHDDWNWEDFLAKAKALVKRNADGTVARWGFVDDWPMPDPWIYSAGGRWVDSVKRPSKFLVHTPEFIRGLQMRQDLIYKHKVMPGPSAMTAMGGLGSSDLFISGKAAMFLSGYWKVPAFRDIPNFRWDVAMFPKGPEGKRGFQIGGSGYGILSTSPNKEAAWKLVRYLSGPEGAKRFAETGLAQPALVEAARKIFAADPNPPANKGMLLEAVTHGVYEPFATNWREVRDGIITPVFDRVWAGAITAAEASAQLSERLAKVNLHLEGSR